jgi:hypothetical protein
MDAIGTSAAKELRTYLDQDWDELNRPPFDHPNRNILWVANGLLRKLRQLKSDPELKSVFVRHIEIYEGELRALAADLSSTDHGVAFVGSIGVGKSTAICTIADLRVTNEGPLNKQVVLEAGAGGTTICEVHIKNGPGCGLIVEPRSDEAIKFDVGDFAEYLLRLMKGSSSTQEGDSQEGPGITKEINRAIRNMSGLAETKRKDVTTGRQIRNDPARDLALKYPEVRELEAHRCRDASVPAWGLIKFLLNSSMRVPTRPHRCATSSWRGSGLFAQFGRRESSRCPRRWTS